MVPKVLLVSMVSQVSVVPRFSKAPMVASALVVSMIPEVPMVPKLLLIPVISRVPQVPEAPVDASPLFLDPKSSLVVLGEVNERSGFLCKVGGFCL